MPPKDGPQLIHYQPGPGLWWIIIFWRESLNFRDSQNDGVVKKQRESVVFVVVNEKGKCENITGILGR